MSRNPFSSSERFHFTAGAISPRGNSELLGPAFDISPLLDAQSDPPRHQGDLSPKGPERKNLGKGCKTDTTRMLGEYRILPGDAFREIEPQKTGPAHGDMTTARIGVGNHGPFIAGLSTYGVDVTYDGGIQGPI